MGYFKNVCSDEVRIPLVEWGGIENTHKWFYETKVWGVKEKKAGAIIERTCISRASMDQKSNGKKKNKAVGAGELLLAYFSTLYKC